VHAALDTSDYDTGVQISDAQIAALPIARHRFHGDWNYTLRPHTSPPTTHDAVEELDQTIQECLDRTLLTHPDLTGMTREQLAAITIDLAKPQAHQHEQTKNTRRGTERRRARGAGRHARLTDADRVLATVPYLRRLCTQAVLGTLGCGPLDDHHRRPLDPPAPAATRTCHHAINSAVPHTSRPHRLHRRQRHQVANRQIRVLILSKP